VELRGSEALRGFQALGRPVPVCGSGAGKVGHERLPQTLVCIPQLDLWKRRDRDELSLVEPRKLTKPISDDTLLASVRSALERSRAELARADALAELRGRYASLSRREREVMALVVSGLLNKQVGGELGISEITVKAHRGKVMRKMKADSLAALVTIAAQLELQTRPLPSAPSAHGARSTDTIV
jgi:DNA-binding CsgD family transcriptional regulator